MTGIASFVNGRPTEVEPLELAVSSAPVCAFRVDIGDVHAHFAGRVHATGFNAAFQVGGRHHESAAPAALGVDGGAMSTAELTELATVTLF